jgi:hypothetical protein
MMAAVCHGNLSDGPRTDALHDQWEDGRER